MIRLERLVSGLNGELLTALQDVADFIKSVDEGIIRDALTKAQRNREISSIVAVSIVTAINRAKRNYFSFKNKV